MKRSRIQLVSRCAGLVSVLEDRYQNWGGVHQLEGTGRRLAALLDELCWTPSRIESGIKGQFKTFENGYDEMLVEGPIKVWTLCPHHLLPVGMAVTVGYVPDGKVLGLSKFARIAVIMGKRPVMQEEYSRELAQVIQEGLAPKGVAVYVVGHHGCMSSRGVGQDVPVVTSIVKGCFEDTPVTRGEFYSIARRNG